MIVKHKLQQNEKGKEWYEDAMPASELFVPLQGFEGGRGNLAWSLGGGRVNKRPSQNSAGCSSRIISSYPESNATKQKEESGAEYIADGFRVRAYSKILKYRGLAVRLRPVPARTHRKAECMRSALHSRPLNLPGLWLVPAYLRCFCLSVLSHQDPALS